MPEQTKTKKRVPNPMDTVALRRREWSIVLAALRCYQSQLERNNINADLLDVATNGGDYPDPTKEQIDDLCEKINLA